MLDSHQGWSAGVVAAGEWMQLDLGNSREVVGVEIQGRNYSEQRVTAFTVWYSMDGSNFVQNPTQFTSAATGQARTRVVFPQMTARYVRINVLKWQEWPSMRAGVLARPLGLGCGTADWEVLGSFPDGACKPSDKEQGVLLRSGHNVKLRNQYEIQPGGQTVLQPGEEVSAYRNGVEVPAWYPATVDCYVPSLDVYKLTWCDGFPFEGARVMRRNIRTKCYLDVCGSAGTTPSGKWTGYNVVTHESPNRDGATGTWKIVLVKVTSIANQATAVIHGTKVTIDSGKVVAAGPP